MDRRNFLAVSVAGLSTALAPIGRAIGQGVQIWPDIDTIYLNPSFGNDGFSGTKTSPLRSLAEAARRVNASGVPGPITILMAEGIYPVEETARFQPEGKKLSAKDRLVIRAEILPDDPSWDASRMPTLIHTLPLKNVWDGRLDGAGGTVDGMLIETSHVSIVGLRFVGMPIVETPREKLLHRVYGISRFGKELDDLEVAHCVFEGNIVSSPFHVCVIARGSGVNVHHCIFYGVKITVVYWQPGTKGHAMTNCVVNGAYGSGVWTSSIDDDFIFKNNVIANCKYAWTWQNVRTATGDLTRLPTTAGAGVAQETAPAGEAVSSRYRVIDSYFSANEKLAGSGTGARLSYIDIDPSFLQRAGTILTDAHVEFELDGSKRNYLAPVAGSSAARTGAGLFMKA
jgi:hypothetical protein